MSDIKVVTPEEEAYDWLLTVYDPDRDERDRCADVFYYVDDLLLDGQFDEVNVIFDVLVDGFLPQAIDQLEISLCFLIVSNGGQDRLPGRQKFYRELESLIEQHPEYEVGPMLGGLG